MNHPALMPLKTYLPMHPKAKLSDADRAAICDWARSESARITAATGVTLPLPRARAKS